MAKVKKVKVVGCPLTADGATEVINAAIVGLKADEEAAAATPTKFAEAEISEIDVKDMQGERVIIIYSSDVTLTDAAVASFTTSPEEGVTIVVKDGEGKVVRPNEDGTYKLAAGSYTYTATAEGYTTQEDQALTVSAGDATAGTKAVTVTMVAD